MPTAERRKSDVPFESHYIMRLSKFRHSEDQRHNKPPKFFNKPKANDTRSDESKAFERRWLG